MRNYLANGLGRSSDLVLDVLRRHQLAVKVVVTGMGIAPDTLKAILRGEQFMTIYTRRDADPCRDPHPPLQQLSIS